MELIHHPRLVVRTNRDVHGPTMLAVVIVSTVLLVAQVGAALPRDRKSRSPDPQILCSTLTLVINSAENCSTGLTHPGVFVLVEYRLVDPEGETAGGWQLLETVNVEPTGHSIYT